MFTFLKFFFIAVLAVGIIICIIGMIGAAGSFFYIFASSLLTLIF